ncbi:zinc finger protein 287-like [Musca vetustissima]|uniref:zinc finger protein 287-like n=1 Tax=Musca vetustissima TaxID=27455 RepID=UPI002AB63A03|nr:zinc finger protein 287-like [Musca vetustissima]
MSLDLTTICRTCMNDDSKYYQLFDYIDEGHTILEMLMEIVPQLAVADDDAAAAELSTIICETCVEQLITCYKFQQMCLDADNQLRQLIYTSKDFIVEVENEWTTTEAAEHSKHVENDDSGEMKIELYDLEDNNEEVVVVAEQHIESYRGKEEEDDKYHGPIEKLENLETVADNGTEDIIETECDLSTIDQGVVNEKQSQNSTLKIIEQNSDIAKSPSPVNEKEPNNNTKNIIEETEQQIMNCFSELIEDDNESYMEIDQLADDMEDTQSEYQSPSNPDNAIDYIETDLIDIEKPKSRGGAATSAEFPCEVCGKIFNTLSRLRRHGPVHSLDKPYACEICKHRFSSQYYLKIHKQSHNKVGEKKPQPPGGFKCPDCPKSFHNQPALASHRQVHSSRKSSKRNIICALCQRAFLSMKTLTDHLKTRHPDAEKFSCDQCGKKFLLEERLQRHMAAHKDLVCTICNKEFTSEPTLKEHMNIHSGACPYLCSECGKAFKFASSLRKHIERHSEISKHHCTQCPRSFKCRSDLNKHAKNHLGLKPFKCDVCGAKFTRGFNLEQHKRLHSEQSLHKCNVCNVTFSTMSHVRRHMRTHVNVDKEEC